jgi:hypothetical protein
METIAQLLDHIGTVEKSYQLIVKRFSEFVEHIKKFMEEDVPLLKAMELDEIDKRNICIRFLDKEIFLSNRLVDDHGIIIAFIRLDDEKIVLEEIKYDTTGCTSLKLDRPWEYLYINNKNHAIYKLLDIIKRSIQK